MDYETHEYALLFPPILEAEFAMLKTDLLEKGLLQPIVIYQGKVLDGRNRLKACQETGVEASFVEYTGSDPLGFVVSSNLMRRQLDESQRAMVAARLANMTRGGDRPSPNDPNFESANLHNRNEISRTQAATMLNVSPRTVATAKQVIDEAIPELVELVSQGAVSVSAAADIAGLPQSGQQEIVVKGEKEILAAAKQIRLVRAQANREESARLKALNPPFIPEGQYGCIVIDPPWEMEKIERDVAPNQAGFDYPTMDEAELSALPMPAADDCHLFCWTTHKHMPMALRLVERWGFRYVCQMVWHKPGGFQPFGLPQYNCEFVLYARKGTPEFIDTKAFPCCFNAPRREHSRKPDEFYEVIRRVTDAPRIDVFSREKREGFAQFGNETRRFG